MSRTKPRDKALVQTTVEVGKLDCAFNNAGIEARLNLHEQSIEDDKLMAVNVRGLFLCMKYEISKC